MERKIFSACFLAQGLGALSAVLSRGNDTASAKHHRSRCIELLDNIVSWSHDPTPLGREVCSGAPAVSPMNVPMILLSLLEELQGMGILESDSPTGKWSVVQEEQWCISEILKHVKEDQQLVLEVVRTDGSVLEDSYEGRHMNPGHAIEAGWFLLKYARRKKDDNLYRIGKEMINWSFERGWDTEHGGGLLYFLDSEGRSPPYLEWDMKLWWPQCEAMVAFAMLYEDTKEVVYLERLEHVTNYALKHFSDREGGGEWFGYLSRDSTHHTHRFKGGAI